MTCFQAEPADDSNGKIKMKDSGVRISSAGESCRNHKSDKSNGNSMWARLELKVRFIDKKFKVEFFCKGNFVC